MAAVATTAENTMRLDLVDVGVNTRDTDSVHVDALAASIKLRGLIVPLVVRPQGRRYVLVAAYHR